MILAVMVGMAAEAQVAALLDSESRTLLKTIRAFTPWIVTRPLDGPKRCT
jgi:hypothetical protein